MLEQNMILLCFGILLELFFILDITFIQDNNKLEKKIKTKGKNEININININVVQEVDFI